MLLRVLGWINPHGLRWRSRFGWFAYKTFGMPPIGVVQGTLTQRDVDESVPRGRNERQPEYRERHLSVDVLGYTIGKNRQKMPERLGYSRNVWGIPGGTSWS